MAYHLQTDGQSERANQRVEQYLWIYGNEEKNDWVNLLPLAKFVHNSRRNKSIGTTPFNLLIEHTPTIQVQRGEMSIPELMRQREWLEQGRLRAQATLRHSQQILVERTKRKKGERYYHSFKEGDQVWLEGTNL